MEKLAFQPFPKQNKNASKTHFFQSEKMKIRTEKDINTIFVLRGVKS